MSVGAVLLDRPTSTADRVGRVLLALCAVSTLGAFANGVLIMTQVSDARVITEAWRTFAYLVFAGLWAMMAAAPRRQPGVWELVLLQKTAITVFALAALDLPDARMTFFVDLSLVVATTAAYVLCRGWEGWRTSAVRSS
ncbi:hypothetical protein ACFFQW_15190 [Umezawaea endophytica]|uniref:Uncharacterized protein n=1 Tax=Umezawaea endophytica TaxID=1654476 RepID=A0A9X2ZXL8_9PSEU|nr:hypothetical protein [Umezawaea endophytica]MCS7475484.1 hypothetical protein [Umezawaea endophytica]